MDVGEFRRLSTRVVASRNSETRAFLNAFDLTPGTTSGWSERTCANWRVWRSANDALRARSASWRPFSAQTDPKMARPGTS